jgi:hypothetical protein
MIPLRIFQKVIAEQYALNNCYAITALSKAVINCWAMFILSEIFQICY